jgi:EmrB/QacA subfamily drug resistance transporter
MAATFMVAIEATVVATAMPHIVARLGGFSYYAWVFSAFLLAQASTTVMFGKLADLHGRKPVLAAGLVIFLVGSALSGFAWSMNSLIAFRLVQGLGAGAVLPIAQTIVADLFTIDERRKTQSYLASLWVLSAVIGPLAGAFIVQHLAWRWVFWINLAPGLIAIAGLATFLHEDVERHDHPIDYSGAVLFVIAVTSLLLAISVDTTGGVLAHPLLFALIFAIATPLFILRERKAKEPMVELSLWVQPIIASANVTTLAAGMALIGLTAMLPIYIQAVLGKSAIESGFTLTAMGLAWSGAATASARLFLPRMGLRRTMRVGGVTMVLGGVAFLDVNRTNGLWLSFTGAFLFGWGMGMMTFSSVMILQESVDWKKRGAATASNAFSQLLGSTLGAAVMGAILNMGLRFEGAGIRPGQVRGLMDHGSGLAARADPALNSALDGALHGVFHAMTVVSALTAIAAFTMPHPQFEETFRRREARSSLTE